MKNSSTKIAIEIAAKWLKKSIDVTLGKGSSHSYSFWLNEGSGWRPGYPETTGYIIPTLIKYAAFSQDKDYQKLALSCAEWLVNIQKADGSFVSGVNLKGESSIFNTAMIGQGLRAAYDCFQDRRFNLAAAKAGSWVVQNQNVDGAWPSFIYRQHPFPAYFTRVAWALLVIDREGHKSAADKTLKYFFDQFQESSFYQWGFDSQSPAFLHTVGYTFRGLWESGQLLHSPDLLEKTRSMLLDFVNRYYTGTFPGAINPLGKADYSFSCPVGIAQMGIVLLKAGFSHEHPVIQQISEELVSSQKSANHPFAAGAIPGSVPFYGPYMRLKYPNWAAKFFIDFFLLKHQTELSN